MIRLGSFAMAVADLCAGKNERLHAAALTAEVRLAQVGDMKMAYYIRGQGFPLVLVNGYMPSMSLWDRALLELPDDEHTLAPSGNRPVAA